MRRRASVIALACCFVTLGVSAETDRAAFQKAKRLAAAGRFSEAEELVRAMVERCPGHCTAREEAGLWLAFAGARARQGLRDQATLTALARAKQLKPDYVARIFEAQAKSIEVGRPPHPLFPLGALKATGPTHRLECAPVAESEVARPVPILCRVQSPELTEPGQPSSYALNATVFYRRSGETEWERLNMNSKKDAAWQLIPCSSTMREGRLEFYVEAQYPGGPLRLGSEADPVPVAIVPTPATLVAFPGQTAPERCDGKSDSVADSTRGLEFFATELPEGDTGPGPEPIRGAGCGHCAASPVRHASYGWLSGALLGAALLGRRQRSGRVRA